MMKWSGLAVLTLIASTGCVYEYYGHDEEVCRPRCGNDSTCMQACSAEQGEVDASTTVVDSDGDGLADQDEGACNTNPGVADTDGDGVLDGDEDPDGDGASNAEEIAEGTDPADGDDVPADDPPPPPPPPPDADGDGLIDDVEGSCNTNPGTADTDGDGVLDGDEDPDGDGFSNAEEIAAGTNPANGGDYPGAPEPQDPPACDAGPSCGEDAGTTEPEDPPVLPEDPADPQCPECTDCASCDQPTPEDPVCPFADEGEECRPEPYCGECEWICQHDGDWAYCMQTCSSCVVTCVDDGCGNDSCSFEGDCGYESSCQECEGPRCPWNDHNVDIDCASLGQGGSSLSALALVLGLLALPLRRFRRR